MNIEDTKPIDALACRVWSGSHYHYPHIERMIADLARLRKLESECHAAGFITDSGEVVEVKGKLPKTKDGVVVMPGETVWNYDQWHNHSKIELVPNGRYGAFFGQQWRPIECCFAEHSAAAKAAEAARGEK